MTGHQMYHHQHSNNVYQNLPRATSVSGSWPPASEHPLFYISIYAAIGLASALASVLSVTAQYTGALRASRILFKYVLAFFSCDTLPTCLFSFPFRQLLVTVVRATFRFHDTTPQGALDTTTADQSPIHFDCPGRMLNRFGKDVETIDSSLAGSLQAVNTSLAGFFAAIITVA